MIRLDAERVLPFLDEPSLDRMRQASRHAHEKLLNRTGAGSDFLGWRDLLTTPDHGLLDRVSAVAERLRADGEVLLCIGIGGSYLGAEAAIRALTPAFRPRPGMGVYFLGHHLGGTYVQELLDHLTGRSVYVNVISKSGTTLEPAIAFRLVRSWMSERFSDVDRRIIVTTDPAKGALNEMQRRHGYEKFEIPGDVGGRFSVMTPVGLLPIACAGIDVHEFVGGGADAAAALKAAETNPALEYAALRNALLQSGFSVEILAAFDPRLSGLQAWWQQLFGESEGKDQRGIYPDSVNYTTDLHSLGQYVQEGRRMLQETFLMIESVESPITVPASEDDGDGLNYLAGRTLHDVNLKAYEGTAEAHADGGVPSMTIWLDRLSPRTLGELIYFFEHAVAVSGYVLGVNPFDQPGVEAYKKNMFRLLGKP